MCNEHYKKMVQRINMKNIQHKSTIVLKNKKTLDLSLSQYKTNKSNVLGKQFALPTTRMLVKYGVNK